MSLPPPASLKRPSKSKPGKIMPMLCQHSHQRNLMCPSGKAHIFAVHPTRHPIPPSGELGSRTLLFGIAAQSAGQSAQTGSDLSDIDFLRLLKSCHPEPPAMQQCEVTLALNLCPGTKNSSPPFSSSGAQTSSAPLTSWLIGLLILYFDAPQPSHVWLPHVYMSGSRKLNNLSISTNLTSASKDDIISSTSQHVLAGWWCYGFRMLLFHSIHPSPRLQHDNFIGLLLIFRFEFCMQTNQSCQSFEIQHVISVIQW